MLRAIPVEFDDPDPTVWPMLYDRDYMSEGRGGRPSTTLVLIGILVACFLVQAGFTVYGGDRVTDLLGLTSRGLMSGKVWLLATYQFLHETPWPWHLLFNCLGLFFIGSHLEEMYGTRRLLWMHFGGGIVGGLIQVAANFLPGHPTGPLVGASAGVLSLLSAYATAFPDREITTFLYFLPVTLRARWIFWFLFLLSLYGTLIPFGNAGHGAHFGGMLFGFLFVKLGGLTEFGGGPLERIQDWIRSKKPAPRVGPTASRIPSKLKAEVPVKRPATSEADFIAREIDPILEKIAQHGLQSLTAEERQKLEAARQKVIRR